MMEQCDVISRNGMVWCKVGDDESKAWHKTFVGTSRVMVLCKFQNMNFLLASTASTFLRNVVAVRFTDSIE